MSKLKAWADHLVDDEANSVTTMYHKTTLNGRDVYVANFQKNGVPDEHNVYPMSSYTEAVKFKEQLITKYKAQGYYTASQSTDDMWFGLSGNKGIGISAQKDSSVVGIPVVWVIFGPTT